MCVCVCVCVYTHTKTGWLFLMLLDKMGKINYELRDLKSQLKNHINDLRTIMSALKETLISHNLRNEISDFDLCLTELLCELNSVDSPQQSISAPFFVSRHIARLKSDHTPNGELKSVTSEEMSYN